MVEGRHCSHGTDEYCHGVRVAPKTLEKPGHLVMHHGVARDDVDEILVLRGVGQLTVQQQVADLEKIAVLRQLLDGIAAIQQHAFVPIDIGDFRTAAGRG